MTSDRSILHCNKHCKEALYKTERYSQVIALLFELNRREMREQKSPIWAVFLRLQYENDYDVQVFNKIGEPVQVGKNNALAALSKSSPLPCPLSPPKPNGRPKCIQRLPSLRFHQDVCLYGEPEETEGYMYLGCCCSVNRKAPPAPPLPLNPALTLG